MNITLMVVILFILAVVGHEAGHALTAIALGYKLKKFYFGIPLEFELWGRKWTTNIYKRNINGVEFGISVLLLGGAVDFYDLEKAPFGKFFLVVAAGPIFNLIVGFLPLLFYYDFQTTLYISKVIFEVVLSSLWQFVSGAMPLSMIAGPVGAMNAMSDFAASYSNGLLLVWIVLNLAFFITNVLPIPAIDGGQILTAALVAIFGEKLRAPLEKVTKVFFYILMGFMVIVLTKDLW